MTEPFVAKASGKARETDHIAAIDRIRELEAGLLGCRQARSELEWECARLAQLANEATARAEKAEADARESLRLVRFMEARVAELERIVMEDGRPEAVARLVKLNEVET